MFVRSAIVKQLAKVYSLNAAGVDSRPTTWYKDIIFRGICCVLLPNEHIYESTTAFSLKSAITNIIPVITVETCNFLVVCRTRTNYPLLRQSFGCIPNMWVFWTPDIFRRSMYPKLIQRFQQLSKQEQNDIVILRSALVKHESIFAGLYKQ